MRDNDPMPRSLAILLLFLAAVLEAGGDALIRVGLRSPSAGVRAGMFALGAAVLFGYGYAVNAPGWDFGRLLGLYVVFFFVVAQLISWLAFGQPPSRAVWLGGVLIVCGGLVILTGP